MADLSRIKLNGTTYNFKDAEARSHVTFSNSKATVINITNAKFNLLRAKSNNAAPDTSYAALAYNDSSWEEITLPHDWSIGLDFNSNSSATHEGGFLDGGDAWYRMEIPIATSMQGKSLFLDFEGIYYTSNIYLNGTEVGSNYMGYNPFRVEITDYVSFTGPNILAIYVTNKQPSSRYYSGSGIYRPIKLVAEDNAEVTIEDIVITTPDLETQKNGVVDTIINSTITGNPDKIIIDILDDNKNVVGTAIGTTMPFTISVLRPKLWDIYEGNLYTARITVQKNTTQYIKTAWFGYRYISFDGSGFYLNGKHTFMKGVCLHHDLGCFGSEANTSAMSRQLDMMVEMGANAIRTSHNPEGENFLRLCAEKGLLVVEEFFDTWRHHKKSNDFATYFIDHWQEVVDSTIKRDINNPAIVMWSIGNEIAAGPYNSADGNYDTYRADAQMIHNRVKQLDPTRYTTTAQSEKGEPGYNLADVVDVIGLNYASNSNYNTYHTRYPNKAIHGSETTSALSSRGVYEYNDGNVAKGQMPSLISDRQCSSYDNNVVTWIGTANSAAEVLKYHENNFESGTQTFGMFVWTGFDYIGEPTPFSSWPSKSSYFGIVDLAGFPKDIYYMYQSRWTTKPMIHILPMNWDYDSGTTQHVWLYSNCDKVELFLNGTSLGTRTKNQIGGKFQYEFSVEYASGNLVANGYDANNVLIAQDMIFSSTKQPKWLQLKAWYNCVDYRTPDVAFIECNVVDAYGVLVPGANNTISFSVTGGSVLGTDNGDATDVTNMHSPNRKAFHGKALCVVRHNGKPGIMTITATAPGLGQATITVEKGLYTGRVMEQPTAFVDAANPPQHPYTNIIIPSDSSSGVEKYQVIVDLVHVTSGNNATEINMGGLYRNTLTVDEGYEVIEYSITMGGVDISNALDLVTGRIIISNVTGDIIVTATAALIGETTYYTIVKSGNNVSYSNNAVRVVENESYITTVTPSEEYELSTVTVTMGNIDITSTAYNNGVVTITQVTGNVEITATATAIQYYSVTTSLLHITSSNTATTVRENTAYTTTLAGETADYEVDDVVVTMNDIDITSTAYSNGVVNIATVTGDIVIAAVPSRLTILRSNYSPNGAAFSDTVQVDFANGEYVLAEIDVSGCSKNMENLLSVGTYIDIYNMKETHLANQGVFHTYYNSTIFRPAVSYSTSANTGNYASGSDMSITNPIVLKVTADGLYLDGVKVTTNNTQETTAMANMIAAGEIKIGSTEGTTRSKATYNSIKVVKDSVHKPSYSINKTTANISYSNSITSIGEGDCYYTSFGANAGYNITDVTVTMGNVDITSTAYNVNTSTIKIPQVTGNIVITVNTVSTTYDSTPVYTNSNLVFDGTNYVDTNLQLFDTDKMWKIEIEFTPDSGQPQNVAVLHCMKEVNPWPGFVFDRQTSSYRIVQNNVKIENIISANNSSRHSLVLEYSGPAHTLTATLDNGTPTTKTGVTYTNIPQTLLIGAYQDTSGNKGRYWHGTVHSINVYYEKEDSE